MPFAEIEEEEKDESLKFESCDKRNDDEEEINLTGRTTITGKPAENPPVNSHNKRRRLKKRSTKR